MSCPILLYQPQPQQQLQIIIEPELQELQCQEFLPNSPLILSCLDPLPIYIFIFIHCEYQEQVGTFLKIQDFISKELLIKISQDFQTSSLNRKSRNNHNSIKCFETLSPQQALFALIKLYYHFETEADFLQALASFSFLPPSDSQSMLEYMPLYAHHFQIYLNFLIICNHGINPTIEKLISIFEMSIISNQLPNIVSFKQLESCVFSNFQDFLVDFISLVQENLSSVIDFSIPVAIDAPDNIFQSIDEPISTLPSYVSCIPDPLVTYILDYITYITSCIDHSPLLCNMIHLLSYSLMLSSFDSLRSRVIRSSICKLCEYLIHSTLTPSIILYRDCVGT